MRSEILRSLFYAAVIVATPLGMKFFHANGFFPVAAEELSQRTTGVVIGMALIAFANLMPKQGGAHSAGEATLRRFSAWTFVLAGVFWTLSWVFAPIAYANAIAMTAVGGALIIVLARCLFRGRTA